MLKPWSGVLAAVGALALTIGTAWAAGPTDTGTRSLPAHGDRAVCSVPAAGARCFAHVVTAADGVTPLATPVYQYGYRPSDLQAAYSLPGTGPSGQGNGPTVAIVDAYDNPNAQDDLAAYRSQFGLPPLCDSAGPGVHCVTFRKVNQTGGSQPPSGNTGWGQEIDLDLDMVSAACPGCNILLVEATSNSFTNLGIAVNYAAGQGVLAISNSYGAAEFRSEAGYGGYYDHAGIAVTASTGDSGYGPQFPAASGKVIAVGGTSLASGAPAGSSAFRTGGGTTWSETVWSGTGSGCSRYFAREDWQTAVPSGGTCANRVIGDVSAVADPSTGVAVYDSYGSRGGKNWYVFGGTSVASPLVASVYAAAGLKGSDYPARLAYGHASGLFDVTAGSNGQCVRGGRRSLTTLNAYLCTAESGYDGPTGMGTPRGLSEAF